MNFRASRRPPPARALVVLFAAALWLGGSAASAHTRSVSYSSWRLDPKGAQVTLSLAQLELTRLPWGPVWGGEIRPELADYLTSRLQLVSGGEVCAPAGRPSVLASARERAVLEWRVECATGGAREIRSRLMHEVAPSHLHFARIRDAAAGIRERVLTGAESSWSIEQPAAGEPASADASLRRYVMIGIQHIGTGPDHLAFVLALILIAARLGEVASVVTGFTLAHSITLAIAVFGLARPEPREIGALVGLSIVLVAAENGFLLGGRPRRLAPGLAAGLLVLAALGMAGIGRVAPLTLAGLGLFTLCYFALLARSERPARLRFAIAFAFGLVHGFGFAGVLMDLSLPTQRLWPALLGFNLGVEIGQLVLVAALWPVLRDLSRLRAGRPHRLLVEISSAALCGIGLYWFLARGLG